LTEEERKAAWAEYEAEKKVGSLKCLQRWARGVWDEEWGTWGEGEQERVMWDKYDQSMLHTYMKMSQ
jgi:hypothetical protein